MVSGFDRYFQIAPCFRDEDPRADRLPGEFYQLDVEMSFVEQEDIFVTMEPVITGVFEEFAQGKSVTKVWPRIPYDTAIAKYGSDKPDLRNPIEMADVTEHFRGSGFKVFAGMIEKDPKVQIWAIPAPTGGSRGFCDRMNSWAQGEGQPGMAYIFWRAADLKEKLEEGPAGPIAKNIGPERTEAIRAQLGLATGDAVFFAAGDPAKFYKFAGQARDKVGQELKLVDENAYALAWIVDFPFYEWNEEDKKVDFSHNPFSMPKGGAKAIEAAQAKGRDALLALKANQYDIVCNGFEIASGSVRNHLPETMVKAFEVTGLGRPRLKPASAASTAPSSTAPPRTAAWRPASTVSSCCLSVPKNLRDISLFPMNQQAEDLLMGAPSEATAKQMRELSLRVIEVEKKG